jgi:hypothetical protein
MFRVDNNAESCFAPPSVLLRLNTSNHGRDVLRMGGSRINSARSLAENVVELLCPAKRPRDDFQPDEHPVGVPAAVFAAAALESPLLVAVDDAHRAEPDAINLLPKSHLEAIAILAGVTRGVA